MKPFWIWRSDATPTQQIQSHSVTPFVQSIGLRWPGGGWLWQFPLAIEVEDRREGTHQRLPIPDPTRTIIWFLAALVFVTLLIAGVSAGLRWRQSRRTKLARKASWGQKASIGQKKG